MNKRKQKLIIGFCAPTAIVGLTAGIAGLAISLKNKQPSIPPLYAQNKITFASTDGAKLQGNTSIEVEAGTTFDRVDKPFVQCSKGWKFVGWVDENGNEIYGNAPIRQDYKLTPVLLTDGETSEYATIKFEPGTEVEGVKLQGNTTVPVMKKHRFYMVNRPSASVKDASGRSYIFKGWYYKTGTSAGKAVGENDVITEDVTLIPKFNAAVTITWNPGDGASITRGKTTTTGEIGLEFKYFNQPQIENGEKYFEGWYKGSIAEANKLTESTIINEDMTVIANWADAPQPAEKYVKLHFNAPNIEGTEFTITPSEYTLVAKNETTFGNVNKPTIADANNNYRLSTKGAQYEYSTDGKVTWNDVDDSMTFTEATTEIRPKMEYAVDYVLISGESTMKPETSKQFTAIVEGGTKTSTVTWKVYSDKECTKEITDSTIAAINANTGVLTIGDPTDVMTIYVQATSTIGDVKSDAAPVYIEMPFTNSSDVWYYDSTSKKWMYFTQDNLCDPTLTTVTPHYVDGTEATAISKETKFGYKITFGDKIKIVNKDFMSNFVGFDGQIEFNNVNYIEESFLAGCTSFNQSLNLNNIYYIAPNFLGGCTSYNQPIDLSSNTGLYEIGDDFMKGCTTFDSALTLPATSYSGLVLGNNFLQNCTSFSQSFELPNGVTYLGDFFMNNCDGYTGTITVNCPITDETCPGSTYCFISEDSSAAIATTGFNVDGTYADDFTAKFPTQSKEYAYRKLLTTKGALTEDEWNAALAQVKAATKVKVDDVSSEIYYDSEGEIEKEHTEHTIKQLDSTAVAGNDTTTIESYKSYDTESGEVSEERYYRLDPTSNVWFSYDKHDDAKDGKIYGVCNTGSTLTGTLQEEIAYIEAIPFSSWTFDGTTSQYSYPMGDGTVLWLKFNATTKYIEKFSMIYTEEYSSGGKYVMSMVDNINTQDSGIEMPTGWTWQTPVNATYDSTSQTATATFTGGMSADYLEWVTVDPSNFSSTLDKYKQIGLTSGGNTVKEVNWGSYQYDQDVGNCAIAYESSSNNWEWMKVTEIGGTWETGVDLYKIYPLNALSEFSIDTDYLVFPIRPFTTTTADTTFTYAENTVCNVSGYLYVGNDESAAQYYNLRSDMTVNGDSVFTEQQKDAGWGKEIKTTNDIVIVQTIYCVGESEESDSWRPELCMDASYVQLGDNVTVYLGDDTARAQYGITVSTTTPVFATDKWTMTATITIPAATVAQFDGYISFESYHGIKTV